MAMLYPTYRDVINAVNATSEDGKPIIESRYSVVVAAAKRARQIVDGSPVTCDTHGDEKALTIAIDELDDGTVRVLRNENADADAE